ncbi:hypothetical protein EDB83DRAFT_100542 [Lactarius deliciosus]|nr:hypothetical protein EDB83DRAFT_100542 [Lactarius deliciosus]
MCRIEYVRSVLRFSLLCAYVHCQKMVHKTTGGTIVTAMTCLCETLLGSRFRPSPVCAWGVMAGGKALEEARNPGRGRFRRAQLFIRHV